MTNPMLPEVLLPVTPDQVFSIGQGVNMLTGSATTAAITGLQTTTTTQGGSNTVIRCITTQEQYSSLLDLTASVEGQVWTEFGKVNAKTSGGFLRSQNLTALSVAFTVYSYSTVSRLYPSQTQWQDAVMNPTLLQALQASPTTFISQYGTHFVSGFLTGGWLLAVISFTADSQSHRDQIIAKIGGGLDAPGEGNIQLTTSMTDNLKSLMTQKIFTLSVASGGFTPTGVDLSNPQNVQDFVFGTLNGSTISFTEQLGTGGQLAAICSAWPTLAGIIPTTDVQGLSPDISQSVLDALREEYMRLEFINQTIQSMQNAGGYVSPGSGQALTDTLNQAILVQGKIEMLQIDDLTALSTDTTGLAQYEQSAALEATLSPIVQGQAVIGTMYNLDAAFNPNTTNDPDESPPPVTFTVTPITILAPTTPGSVWTPDATKLTTVVQSSHHSTRVDPGTGISTQYEDLTFNLGFVYVLDLSDPTKTKLQEQAKLYAACNMVDQNGNATFQYAATPVLGTSPDQSSDWHWQLQGDDFNHCAAWFGP